MEDIAIVIQEIVLNAAVSTAIKERAVRYRKVYIMNIMSQVTINQIF